MRTIEEWYETLVELTRGTNYGVLIKTEICSPVVAIVPKGYDTPQRIAIYPKKTKNSGLVFENDVFQIINDLFSEFFIPFSCKMNAVFSSKFSIF